MTQRTDLPRVIDTGAFFDARAAEVQSRSSLFCRRCCRRGSITCCMPHTCHVRGAILQIGDIMSGVRGVILMLCSMRQVQALQQVLSADRGQASGQHGGRQGRRRTTSYKSYRHTRRPNRKLQEQAVAVEASRAAAAATGNTAPEAGGKSTAAEAAAAAQRPTSRAMRRRPGRLQAAAEQSCAAEPVRPAQAGASLRKLETHLWHAKRMVMQERWANPGSIGCRPPIHEDSPWDSQEHEHVTGIPHCICPRFAHDFIVQLQMGPPAAGRRSGQGSRQPPRAAAAAQRLLAA
jgi:hypothetical protein